MDVSGFNLSWIDARTQDLISMQRLWQDVQVLLRNQISPQSFDIWLGEVRPLSVQNGVVDLEVPNRFHGDWIVENYLDVIRRSFCDVLGKNVNIRCIVRESSGGSSQAAKSEEDEDPPSERILEPAEDSSAEQIASSIFKGGRPPPDKTFDNFVVGACNEFAHAASLAVADFPGQQNNPLFIYSDTGLGKTHLLHAIANRILDQDQKTSIMYVTAEQFMNEMINALRYKRMSEFRERFRARVDILLMDDIQFLGGKDRTQEEFFHTFQALLGSGRQIVLTADMLPRDIKGLEERLRTRFEGGLIADIQPPDMETLLAILRVKAEALNLTVSQEVGLYIVGGVRNNNVRELEGVLNMLAAKVSFYQEPLTLETVKKHLQHVLKSDKPLIQPDQIIQAVARFHNVKASDIRGASRLKRLVRPRQVAIYLIREHTELSFPDIGKLIGNRDHSTIQYACRKVKETLEKDPDLSSLVEMIEKNLGI